MWRRPRTATGLDSLRRPAGGLASPQRGISLAASGGKHSRIVFGVSGVSLNAARSPRSSFGPDGSVHKASRVRLPRSSGQSKRCGRTTSPSVEPRSTPRAWGSSTSIIVRKARTPIRRSGSMYSNHRSPFVAHQAERISGQAGARRGRVESQSGSTTDFKCAIRHDVSSMLMSGPDHDITHKGNRRCQGPLLDRGPVRTRGGPPVDSVYHQGADFPPPSNPIWPSNRSARSS